MENGFISLDRKIIHWEWYKNKTTFALFIHLLLTVNWEDGRFEGNEIKRGSCATSLESLAKGSHLSIQNVRTAIKHLKSTGEVTEQIFTKYRIITVSKYNEYQTANRVSNKQLTNNQQTTNNNITSKQVNKNNNDTTLTVAVDLLNYFNEICSTNLKMTPNKRKQINARLKVFSIDEIKRAILKRSLNPWHQGSNPDSKKWFKDWDSLFRNDDKIENALILEITTIKIPHELTEHEKYLNNILND